MDITKPEYWENQYINNRTMWDIGYISPPLKEYFDQINYKNIKILIPGCGNAYEADYLIHNGFKNVFLLDWSEKALNNFKLRMPDFPEQNLINQDFFRHNKQYDLIIEQTFFCSIPPEGRQRYADKSAALLKNGGKLVGLLFDCEFDKGPPFGGNKPEYESYFSKLFDFKIFERSYNSIKPRRDRELFFVFIKK